MLHLRIPTFNSRHNQDPHQQRDQKSLAAEPHPAPPTPEVTPLFLKYPINSFPFIRKEAPRVVIIDDNPLDAELAVSTLREILPLATVTVLHDALDALDYLASEEHDTNGNSAPADLVLLDINMPRLNGFEVLAALRADPQTRSMNIVLCSTSADTDDMRVGGELGANGYLIKPMTLDKLGSALEAVMQQWT